jgi:cell wall-associated NlpC family hydrolase
MKQALADAKAAAINFGDALAPIANDLANHLRHLAEDYNDLTPAQKEFLAKLAEIAVVAGPAVFMLGKLEKGLGTLYKAYKLFSKIPPVVGLPVAGAAVAGAVVASGGSQRQPGAADAKKYPLLSKLEHDFNYPRGYSDYEQSVYAAYREGLLTQAQAEDALKGGPRTSGSLSASSRTAAFSTLDVQAAATPFAGVPYQFGGGHAAIPGPSFASGHGRSGLGLDCSGYARAVLANLGITVNGTADTLLGSAKSHPPVSKLQPGDLVFYEGIHPQHVMVYIGNGQVIGETHTGAQGPEVKPVGYLKITGTGRYTASENAASVTVGKPLEPNLNLTTETDQNDPAAKKKKPHLVTGLDLLSLGSQTRSRVPSARRARRTI